MKKCFEILLVIFSVFFGRLSAQVDPPELIKVSVNLFTGNTEVYWLASSDTKVQSYEILKADMSFNGILTWQSDFGPAKIPATNPLVSVFRDRDVFNTPQGYKVRGCYNTDPDTCSGVEEWTVLADSTMLLQGFSDSCFTRVDLTWNDYNTWNPDSTEYRIYRTVNKSDFFLEGTYAAGTEQAYIPITEQDEQTIYFVAAIREKDGRVDSATSTSITINTVIAKVPEYINTDYATVSGGGIDLRFTIDPASELNTYNILRSTSEEGAYDSIAQIITSDKIIQFTDETDPLSGPYYYQLVAINYCDNPTILSNSASSILLTGISENLEITLNWNEYYNWLGGVENYTLSRRIGNTSYEVISTQNTTNFIDNTIQNPEEGGLDNLFCYVVTANEGNSNQYGIDGTSRSNEVCFEIDPNVRFEFNAFTPGELNNNSFGPLMDYAPGEYKFQIHNRSGFVVYESTDPNDTRWNGLINGKPAPQDAYTYIVKFSLPSGKNKIIKGMVSVVYP